MVPAKDFFDFFGLPRELRDHIYDNATVCKTINVGRSRRLWFYASHLPTTNLLLVGRQFRDEYRHRVSKLLAITVEDHLGPLEDHNRDALPAVFRQAWTLHCILRASSLEDASDLHIELRQQFVNAHYLAHHELPNLRSLSIDVFLNSYNDMGPLKDAISQQAKTWTALKALTSLTVYHKHFGDQACRSWNYSKGKHALLKWKPGTDDFEEIDEVEASGDGRQGDDAEESDDSESDSDNGSEDAADEGDEDDGREESGGSEQGGGATSGGDANGNEADGS